MQGQFQQWEEHMLRTSGRSGFDPSKQEQRGQCGWSWVSEEGKVRKKQPRRKPKIPAGTMIISPLQYSDKGGFLTLDSKMQEAGKKVSKLLIYYIIYIINIIA